MRNSTSYTRIMARAALSTVVLFFLPMLHSSEAGAGEILVPPESQAVPLGTNATFVCTGRGATTNWIINNTVVGFGNKDTFIERGFVFQTERVYARDDDTQNINNLTMTVLATIENNNTMINCLSTGDITVTSDVVNLTVLDLATTPFGPFMHGILVPPESQAVPLGTNATFVCSGRGRTTNWIINNTPVVFGNQDIFIARGFVFQTERVHTSADETQNINNLMMTVLATIENNNTMINCLSTGDGPPVASDVIKLTVIGNPPPVQLAVSVLNATTLQVSWDPPFTFTGHEILYYDITVENKTTGETIIERRRVLGAEERVVSVSSPDGGIAQKCNEITFTVTATNDIGESDPTTKSGWLPIAPGPFPSPAEIEILFESDGTPVAQITFGPPLLCPTHEFKYTIVIEGTKDGEDIDSLQIGPKSHSYDDGTLVVEAVVDKLVADAEYNVTVDVETIAGSSSDTIRTNTSFNPTTPDVIIPDVTTPDVGGSGLLPTIGGQKDSNQGNDDWITIAIVASGCGGILLLVVLTVVFVIIGVHRKKARAVTELHPPMVANPIYEWNVPVYETIEEAAVSPLPSAPHVQECPYHGQPVVPWYETGTPPQMNDRFPTDAAIPSSVMSEDNYTVMNAAGAEMAETT